MTGGTLVSGEKTVADFEESSGAQMAEASYAAMAQAAGVPEMYVPPNAAAAMLFAVLGDVTTTGIADPWTHEIVPATTLPWMTWWRNLGALLFGKSFDCKVTQLVINGESNQPLKMTATVMGLDPRHKPAPEATAAIEVTDRVLYYDGKGALQLEGVAVPCMRSFTLTINRNGESIPGDDIIPCDITEGKFEVTLETTALFSSTSLYNRIMFGTATPTDEDPVAKNILELGGTGVDLKFTRVAAAPGPARSIQIVIPRMAVAPFTPAIGTGNSPMTQVLSMRAYAPAGGAPPITATVLNGLADVALGV